VLHCVRTVLKILWSAEVALLGTDSIGDMGCASKDARVRWEGGDAANDNVLEQMLVLWIA
jgi:hypothetical protein